MIFIKGTCDLIAHSKLYALCVTVVLYLSIIQDSGGFYFLCNSTTLTLIPLLVMLYSEYIDFIIPILGCIEFNFLVYSSYCLCYV